MKIGAVSSRTGLSPMLLRAWERRYGLLEPKRTATGQRVYTEQDIMVLRNARILRDSGWRIGDIAQLGRERIIRQGRELASSAPATDTPAPAGPREGELEADLPLAILNALPCGVVVTDTKGRTRWVNPGFSEICGYGLADLFGKPPGELLHGPGTDAGAVQTLRQAVTEKRPCATRILNYDKAGNPYLAHLAIVPLGLAADCRGFVGLVQTVREQPDDSAPASMPMSPHLAGAIQSLASAAGDDPAASGTYLALIGFIQAIAKHTPQPPQ